MLLRQGAEAGLKAGPKAVLKASLKAGLKAGLSRSLPLGRAEGGGERRCNKNGAYVSNYDFCYRGLRHESRYLQSSVPY